MAKNIFIIVDKGNVWEITDTTVQPDNYVVDPEMVYECKDKELFKWVKQKLETAQIQYPKDISGKLSKEDLLVFDLDPLSFHKEKTLNKGREYISTRLNAVSLFEMFEFIVCNNFLIDAGYIITDKNRREKYLQVIEEGSSELIDVLEKFLNCRDRLEGISGWYRQYKQFENDVRTCKSKIEVDDRYRQFVQIFE